MRLIFIGAGDFGLPTLAWMRAHHQVAAVVSQPDRPAGRKRKLTPTPISNWAQAHELPVLKTDNVNEPRFVEKVRAMGADAAVIVAFGQKLSPQFVDALGKLAINLHASLLPKFRGAAPINWAMIRGEKTTGVTVIGIAQKMDAGPMYAKRSLQIDPHETAGQLHDRLSALGPEVVGQVLSDLERDRLSPEQQDEDKATLAPKLGKADGTVDFAQSADQVRARVHGLTPWPGCRVQWHCQATGHTTVLSLQGVLDLPDEDTDAEAGTVLEGFKVATGSGLVQLVTVQAPGKKPMGIDEFARGHRMAAGDRLARLG